MFLLMLPRYPRVDIKPVNLGERMSSNAVVQMSAQDVEITTQQWIRRRDGAPHVTIQVAPPSGRSEQSAGHLRVFGRCHGLLTNDSLEALARPLLRPRNHVSARRNNPVDVPTRNPMRTACI